MKRLGRKSQNLETVTPASDYPFMFPFSSSIYVTFPVFEMSGTENVKHDRIWF